CLELIIKGEGGLYIKELISGDSGRTEPSVSSVLGVPARCVALDVLEVGDEPSEKD
ncbi:MAG: tRNA pseudouridine(54/55) synthase Pus10, partial [Methanothermobacter thermautotrophicus]